MNCKWSVSLLKWRTLLTVCILLIGKQDLSAQSNAKGFKQLSKPEKHWVMAHPFIAKKAYRITQEARRVTDSLENAGVLSDGNGGQLDAFRHAFWMASLVQEISARKARKLGQAHEKGNYLEWKKGKNEDGSRADSLMCDMDLKNNEKGMKIFSDLKYQNGTVTLAMIRDAVLVHLINGNLVMMQKDESGNFYDCEGNMIDPTMYDGKWFIPKCEVKSSEAVKRG